MVGSAVAPCIKITGNHETYSRMAEDMDFDASPILRGELSQDGMAVKAGGCVAETAAGTSTSEALGHREFSFPINIRKNRLPSNGHVKKIHK